VTATSEATQRIRRATRADIPFLAWCNYEASSPAPGFCYWDPLLAGLGSETMAFIEAVLAADALAWGDCEDFFVIEEGGRLIAGASGFMMDAQDFRPFRLERLPAVAQILGWSDQALAEFRKRYEAVWSDPRDPTLAASAPWTIECVAVIPEARGRGLAKQLLRAILEEGRRQGLSHGGIAVTTGNLPAQRAYEALGFELYIAYGSAYFEGAFPGTTKYRIALG
jgi:ribosomal protein S18 acetylase RimI-like enzyme